LQPTDRRLFEETEKGGVTTPPFLLRQKTAFGQIKVNKQ
jgi:hypothetical protein